MRTETIALAPIHPVLSGEPLAKPSAPPRLRGSFLLFIAILLSAVSIPQSRADEATARFLWEQANANMASARAPEDYLDAARVYNRLVTDGARNGPLFFNLGTALLLAGDGPNAVAALQRAERYAGSTPEIRTNLKLARAVNARQAEAELPWQRVLFFWHYDLPARVRLVVVLAGWSILWAGVFLRQLTRPQAPGERAMPVRPGVGGRIRTLGGSCVFFGILLSLVFGASALITGLQEQQDVRTWPERVWGVTRPSPEVKP